MLGSMEAELAEKGQRLGKELTRGVPLMSISRSQAQEIASRSVVKRLGLLEHPPTPSCEQRNLTAFFNHDDCPREEMGAVLFIFPELPSLTVLDKIL